MDGAQSIADDVLTMLAATLFFQVPAAPLFPRCPYDFDAEDGTITFTDNKTGFVFQVAVKVVNNDD